MKIKGGRSSREFDMDRFVEEDRCKLDILMLISRVGLKYIDRWTNHGEDIGYLLEREVLFDDEIINAQRIYLRNIDPCVILNNSEYAMLDFNNLPI
jgi:hypothetical protein